MTRTRTTSNPLPATLAAVLGLDDSPWHAYAVPLSAANGLTVSWRCERSMAATDERPNERRVGDAGPGD